MTRCSSKRIARRGAYVQPDHVCDSYREFDCGHCGREIHVCRCCDHGQVYCPDGECGDVARASKKRVYRANHQRTKKGRRPHAQAQARYRLRLELALIVGMEEVTDHPSTESSSSATLEIEEEENETTPIPSSNTELVRCDICGRLCRPFVHRWSFW